MIPSSTLRWMIAFLLVWWAVLYWADFPQPKYDDIFFAGPAISLAGGQGLTNPHLKTWAVQFHTDRFFMQPPFHSYLLSGWLRLFGLGAGSLRSFTIASCLGVGVCMIMLGRKTTLGWPGTLAVSLLASTYCLQSGLRPEATGLFACGLAMLGWTGSSRLAWFCGSVFGAAAPLIHPFTAALVLPLGIWCMLRRAGSGNGQVRGEVVGECLGLSGLAAALVFVLFFVAIDGQLAEFRRVFTQHAALRTTGMGLQWQVLWENMHVGLEPVLRWPTLGVLGLGVTLAGLQRSTRQAALSTALLFLSFLILGTMLYTAYVIHMLYLLALLAAAFVGGTLRGRQRAFFGLLWTVAALLMTFPGALAPFLRQSPAIDPARVNAQVDALLLEPGKRLLLDEYAARYVFDWKLPAGAEDWLHCHRQPGTEGTFVRLSNKPAADIWVVEAQKLEALIPDSGVKTERIILFGYRTSLPLKPGDFRIIP